MSKLTISNLEEARDLDSGACEAVKGGFEIPGLGSLPYGLGLVSASVNSAAVSQNAINLVMGGSQGAGDTTNVIGTANFTPVNLSPVTIVQGGLPA